MKGLFLDWYERSAGELQVMIRRYVKIFKSKVDFVDHCSSEVPLEVDLDNLENVFIFFFGFLSSILLIAIVIRKRLLLLAILAKTISKVKNLLANLISQTKRIISKCCLISCYFSCRKEAEREVER